MRELKINLKPLIARLELTMGGILSTDQLSGRYKSVFSGKSTNFETYRDYLPTDDAMMIDWKASVRTNKLLVRVLQEERDINIIFLVDVSNSMLCSSIDKLKCEYSAELVATLGFAMMSVGDRVGLMLLTDRLVDFMLPATGTLAYHKFCKMVSDPKNYGGNFDLVHGLKFIVNNDSVRKGSVVFIVSDFFGLKKGWEEYLKVASYKFKLNAIIVRDVIDTKLPDIKGGIFISDPYSKNKLVIDSKKAADMYKQIVEEETLYLKKLFNRMNIGALELDTSKPFLGPILSFFERLGK